MLVISDEIRTRVGVELLARENLHDQLARIACQVENPSDSLLGATHGLIRAAEEEFFDEEASARP